ncbi:MAG: flagellar basal body-associated FliL family protein [Desulfovibrio sp.]|jgi:flagellar FliL protein|nr:flagellar basal body-associated FliL family protein [Desulfovibrio sp.]
MATDETTSLPPVDEDRDPAAPAPEQGDKTSSYKVELDMDDAPFLKEKEEEKAALEEPPAPPSTPEQPPEKPKFSAKFKNIFHGLVAALKHRLNTRRRRVIAAAILLVPAMAGGGLYFFLWGGSESQKPVESPVTTTVVVSSATQRDEGPAAAKFLYILDLFFLELRGAEGEIRFLRCGFSIPTDNETLMTELAVKNIAVRDSIYYYLTNKPLTFLADAKSAETLKEDIVSVVNENIATEKIQAVYIEEYIVSPD